jgi:TctA family transporter
MVLFVIFLIIAGFAVARAEGMWKLWNVLIILASCGVGFFVAYLVAPERHVLHLALPLTLAFGALGAVLCPRMKKERKTESSSKSLLR